MLSGDAAPLKGIGPPGSARQVQLQNNTWVLTFNPAPCVDKGCTVGFSPSRSSILTYEDCKAQGICAAASLLFVRARRPVEYRLSVSAAFSAIVTVPIQ